MSNQVSYGGQPDGGAAQAPASAVPEQTQPQVEKQPEYITREEAQRLVQEAADQAFRKAQSSNDRFKARVIDPFEKILQEYTSTTGQKPPDQAVKALEMLKTDVPQQQPSRATDPAGEIERKTDELYKKAGFYVEEADPEAKGIDQSSPERFLQTLEAALVAKASRINKLPAVQEPNPAAIPALGGTGVQVNPISKINDPAELLRIGLGGRK